MGSLRGSGVCVKLYPMDHILNLPAKQACYKSHCLSTIDLCSQGIWDYELHYYYTIALNYDWYVLCTVPLSGKGLPSKIHC